MTKKNLLAALLLVSAVALMLTGFLAFFTDREDTTVTGTAGIVEIEVEADFDLADFNNINPGDHDWELAEYLGYADWAGAGTSITDGTLHPISLTVTNIGNKSVKTRHSIDITVDFLPTNPVLEGDFMFFLTETEDRAATGAKELEKKYYLFEDAVGNTVLALYFDDTDVANLLVDTAGYYVVDADDMPVDSSSYEDFNTCKGIRYILFDDDPDSGYILKGLLGSPGAEREDTDGGDGPITYPYYLGLKAQADNLYQGATVTVVWSVEAIQHRNTDSTKAWTKITSATINGKVPTNTQYADGTDIT